MDRTCLVSKTSATIIFILVVCVLLCSGLTCAGVLHPRYFVDHFLKIDKRHWTVESNGGPHVGVASRKLQFLIPKDARGDPFSGLLHSRDDFFVRGMSLFQIRVYYSLMRWPQPNNGIRAALNVYVWNRSGTEVIEEFCAGRISDPDYGGEMYMICSRSEGCSFFPTSDKRGVFRVWSDTALLPDSVFRVDTGEINKKSFTIHSKRGWGHVSWRLGAWGHDWKFIKKPVLVGFDNFFIRSSKGFEYPD